MKVKKNEKVYQSIIEEALWGTSHKPGFPKMPNPIRPKKEPSDYILEAENAGKLATEGKNAQEIEKLRQILCILYKGQTKNYEEIENLKKQQHFVRKSTKDFNRIVWQIIEELKRLSASVYKLQKQNEKCRKALKGLKQDVLLLERIISCMSFISGVSAFSDDLDEIARNWNKATRHGRKKNEYLDAPVIDVSCKEVK